ncbi:2,4-dienoyl-CoA reductase-like NADH-dependent reductase (Old Yellow Enzyme family) [Chitinophaga polysaccharea]|uniref:2,4-dienoyl-CoA reductase-like NADH-dependent reductase (Old Yellow Enzyme family) n=1 Tax=Chitinophaga polysaccharea TaxID=1293035 RepID=A0A561PC84_9BACT|nr:NADH:flavin oxidoreductase [Chitinophaga polysaccharea]TWF35737.1 2,4-dienoyl-CoA reductase-like NADH-dependent reductase (Old Yellow Enzyme family) [Chitinophaga polysaccharea]
MTTHPILAAFDHALLQAKNRAVVAPMSRASATLQGVPTGAMQAYYEKFAVGGFGIIITEGLYTDTLASQAYPHQPGIVTPAQIAGWRAIAGVVKAQGSIFIAQLMHAGALSQHLMHTLAPSAVQPMGKKLASYGGGDGPFPLPAAMTTADIREAITGYVQSAENALAAGFHGVEIHAANGYLLDQFLTDYTNLRGDEYGGSIRHRFRIIAAIIAGIRAKVPAGFIIGLRLSEGKVNNGSYRWPGGVEMAASLLAEVKQAAVDYVHISGEGSTWEKLVYDEQLSLTTIAKRMVDRPVVANGGLHNLEVARRVLEEGHADFISLGHAALANPDWPARVREGLALTDFERDMATPFPPLQ